MLASKNLIPPCTTPDEALHWIDLLAGELTVRLLEAREAAPGLWPKTVVLSWRTGYGYGNNMRSRQTPFAYAKVVDAEYIAKMGKKLWKEACPSILRAKGGMDIHSVSILMVSPGLGLMRTALAPILGRGEDGKWTEEHRRVFGEA
jgi:DNA polymerase eta